MGGSLAGGVVAGDGEQDEEGPDLLVGQALTVDLGVHERGHEVVGGIARAVRGELLCGLLEGRDEDRHRLERVRRDGEVGVGYRDGLLDEVGEWAVVGLGDADHPHDGHRRQPGGDARHEVAALARHKVGDDRLDVAGDAVLELADVPRGERRGDQAAEADVVLAVHRQERLRELQRGGESVAGVGIADERGPRAARGRRGGSRRR